MVRLTKCEPFPSLGTFNDWMEDEFANFFPSHPDRETDRWHPAVDILENENEFNINVELPGVENNAIDMQVEKNILTLKGERKMEKKKNKGKYARAERYYGSFQRSFRLPDAVDADNLTASLEKGVLSIRLPKKEETKPRSIKVDMK